MEVLERSLVTALQEMESTQGGLPQWYIDSFHRQEEILSRISLAAALGILGGESYVRALRSLPEVTGAHAVLMLSMVGIPDTEIGDVSQQERFKHLGAAVSEMLRAGMVAEEDVVERLNMEAFDHLDHPQLKDFKSPFRRMITSHFYTLWRFNLTCQEPEGFTKLGLLLAHYDYTLEEVNELCSRFALDRLRVLMIPFEVATADVVPSPLIYEAYRPEEREFAGQLFGVVLRILADTDRPIPLSLVDFAAICMGRGYFSRAHFLPHINKNQDLDKLKEEGESIRKTKLQVARTQIEMTSPLEDEQSRQEKGKTIENLRSVEEHKYWRNQRMMVMVGHMRCGQWESASYFQSVLEHHGFFPVSFQPYREALCDHLEHLLSEAYRHIQPDLKLGQLSPAVEQEHAAAQALPYEWIDVAAYLGWGISTRPRLISMLARVSRAYFCTYLMVNSATAPEDDGPSYSEAKALAVGVLRDALLPGLAMLDSPDPPLTVEVYSVAKVLPFQSRWRAYDGFRGDVEPHGTKAEPAEDVHPELWRACRLADKELNNQIKRASTDRSEMRDVSRNFMRGCINNPSFVSQNTVVHVKNYENLIPVIVDGLRHVGPLVLDSIMQIAVRNLCETSTQAPKLKEDGNLAEWVVNIARFLGQLGRRYVLLQSERSNSRTMGMDITPAIKLVRMHLMEGSVIELIVLIEMIRQMTSIDIVDDVGDSQLRALAGGPTLRFHAITPNVNLRGMSKQQAARGRQALTEALRGMSGEILTVIGEAREKLMMQADDDGISVSLGNSHGGYPHKASLKIVASLIDFCNTAFLFLTELLTVSARDGMAELPPIPRLSELSRRGVRCELLFAAHRPWLRRVEFPDSRLSDHEKRATVAIRDDEDEEGDAEMVQAHGEAEEAEAKVGEDRRKKWTFGEVADMIKSCQSSESKSVFSDDFAVIFWTFSMYDLRVPREEYDSTNERVENDLAAVKRELNSANDKDEGAACARTWLEPAREALKREYEEQVSRVTDAEDIIEQTKRDWIREPTEKAHRLLFGDFIWPRTRAGIVDAEFAANFVRLLMERNVPNFSFPQLWDFLTEMTETLVLMCTPARADRLAYVFKEVWDLVAHIRSLSKEEFDGYVANRQTLWELGEVSPPSHEGFMRRVLRMETTVGKKFSNSMQASEWLQARNAMKMVSVLANRRCFPILKETGDKLRRAAADVEARDSREDLKTMAKSTRAAIELFESRSNWVTAEQLLGKEGEQFAEQEHQQEEGGAKEKATEEQEEGQEQPPGPPQGPEVRDAAKTRYDTYRTWTGEGAEEHRGGERGQGEEVPPPPEGQRKLGREASEHAGEGTSGTRRRKERPKEKEERGEKRKRPEEERGGRERGRSPARSRSKRRKGGEGEETHRSSRARERRHSKK